MKKISILLALFWLFGFTAFSQEEEAEATKENNNKSLLGYFIAHDSKPERIPYASGYLIDNQTNVINPAKTLEFIIQHRFASMDNGISDLYGIYGPGANSRLALNYSILDWLNVGYGITKQNMLSDFSLKANILQQSRDKKVPLSVTYYHNFAIDGQADKNFGINYKFSDRFTFFHQLLLTRKFCNWFTLSAGASFTHFNKVDSLYEHDKVALHFLGRFKISDQSSIIINYDQPLIIEGIKEWDEINDPPNPNLGIGWEIATVTHAFQIFIGTSTFLVPQHTVMLTQDDWMKGDVYIGFNITRMWNF